MPAGRLTVVDDLLLRNHRRSGFTPLIIQGVWRGAGSSARLNVPALHERLASGRLGYRVRTPRIPTARRQWIDARARHEIDRETTVSSTDVVSWIDSRRHDDLDPARGPGWRLSVADVDDSTCLLVVTCSHALIDGRGLLSLLADSVPESGPPDRSAPTEAIPDSVVPDLRDALRQCLAVSVGTVAAVAGAATSSRRRKQLRRFRSDQTTAPSPRSDSEGRWQTLIAEIDGDRWDSQSRRAGGTPTTAFVRACGRLCARLTARASVRLGVAVDSSMASPRENTPHSGRPGDTRPANSVDMAVISLSLSDDQATVRQRCRRAYAATSTAPAGFPPELIQVLPDPLVDRLVPAPGRYDAMCSVLGALPDALHTIDGLPMTSVAGRALGPTADRLSMYVLRTGDRYVITVNLRADPTVGSVAARDLLEAELGPVLRWW